MSWAFCEKRDWRAGEQFMDSAKEEVGVVIAEMELPVILKWISGFFFLCKYRVENRATADLP